MPSTDEPRCDICGEETDLLVPSTDDDGRHCLVCQDCEEVEDMAHEVIADFARTITDGELPEG